MNHYEQKIIGGILSGYVSASSIHLPGQSEDSDFSECVHAAQELERENMPIDPELLHTHLPESFYAADDFHRMSNLVASASVVFDAIEKVKGSALRTYLIAEASSISLDEKHTGGELLDKLRQVFAVAERDYKTSENNFVFLKDLKEQALGVYRDFHAGISYAVPTGFDQMDNLLLDGFSKGDEHIVVGFTGQGKSALALNCAINQARAGFKVAVVSREMSAIENVMRLQASDAKIERWKMRKGMHSDTLWALEQHFEKIEDLPIAFDTRTSNVENLYTQMLSDEQFDILYVDYLQLMTSSNNTASRANEVQTISRTLKQIAMERRIPVISLCQFNRGAVGANVYDIMSYLKESSGIEQDASTISYIQVEKSKDNSQYKDAELTVLKNRNGATFKPVYFSYRGETFTFTEKVEQESHES